MQVVHLVHTRSREHSRYQNRLVKSYRGACSLLGTCFGAEKEKATLDQTERTKCLARIRIELKELLQHIGTVKLQ